MSWWDEKADR
jgi:hypothetical protein